MRWRRDPGRTSPAHAAPPWSWRLPPALPRFWGLPPHGSPSGPEGRFVMGQLRLPGPGVLRPRLPRSWLHGRPLAPPMMVLGAPLA
jgi:hypothetical protein